MREQLSIRSVGRYIREYSRKHPDRKAFADELFAFIVDSECENQAKHIRMIGRDIVDNLTSDHPDYVKPASRHKHPLTEIPVNNALNLD